MKNFLLLTILLFPFTLKAENCHSIKTVSWLLGDWQSQKNDRTITESWHQVSDKTIEGRGTTYAGSQFKSSESLRIVLMSNALYYIAKVEHNPLPVAFKLTSCTGSNVIFENHNHDFPKRIEYTFVDKGNIRVNVSDGKSKSFSLNLIQLEKI